ncbi:hypothetical protein [Macrococcus equipercicus]|nr:hypothetical protein [Macrococcus equipercicus]
MKVKIMQIIKIALLIIILAEVIKRAGQEKVWKSDLTDIKLGGKN